MTTPLELLSPARNLECGINAIDHGADAVYIGAPKFGARAAAGNSIEDIAALCSYAHRFDAKVYVTVNTIIYDDEIDETLTMVKALKDAGADAILLQDMGLLSLIRKQGIDIRVHASTQTDNRTVQKVKWLRSMGIRRVVLARELSIAEIADIHNAVPDVELEVFVHGALCVSYSGQCYASQHCFTRSANRGECAQFCRMAFSLTDSENNIIEKSRHLLSLKDMAQIDNLERLAASGAVSFKIEGRLKDADYVKNVTAAYSERLNALCRRYPEKYRRASMGKCTYTFKPDIQKSFNRGFTTYFADGRQASMASFNTPKALGEPVGKVKEIRGNSFNVSSTAAFSNGDGLCFFNSRHELVGFRVNKAEGNRLYPLTMPRDIKAGTQLYRNHDQALQALLSKPSASRKISVTMSLRITPHALTLTMTDERGGSTSASMAYEPQTALKPQEDNIKRQLLKLGNTIYQCDSIEIDTADSMERPFIPSSLLSAIRREVTEKAIRNTGTAPIYINKVSEELYPREYAAPYLYNAANAEAIEFYNEAGIEADALETHSSAAAHGITIMQCRYCIKAELGYCTKYGKKAPWREPLKLVLDDGREFTVTFNCKRCEMNILA